MRSHIWLMRLVFPALLRRKAPSTIPRSGPSAQSVNCYTLQLNDGDEPYLLVDRVDSGGVTGLHWNGNIFEYEASVPWRWVADFRTEITHYFGTRTIAYFGIFDYVRLGATQWYRLWVISDVARQQIFNWKRLTTKDRISVLESLTEQALEDWSSSGKSAPSLVAELHTVRIMRHPECTKLIRYYTAILDSLVLTGELEKSQTRYKVRPNAFATLAEYEEQERRHTETLRLSRSIAPLTAALVLVGALQAGILYLVSN